MSDDEFEQDPWDILVAELLQHHFEIKCPEIILRTNREPQDFAEAEKWVAERSGLVGELILSFSRLEEQAGNEEATEGIRQCLRYLYRFRDANFEVFQKLMYMNPTHPPRIPLSAGLVWAWMNGPGTPHWAIVGTGVVVE